MGEELTPLHTLPMQRHVTASAQQHMAGWVDCIFAVFGNGQCMVKFNVDEVAAAFAVRLTVVLVALDLLERIGLTCSNFCGY